MKPVIGKYFLAESDDEPSTRWTFRFVYSRFIRGRQYFLGVKVGKEIDLTLSGDNPQAWWFNDQVSSIQNKYGGYIFKLYKASNSKRH